jgi:hypothetical protein
VVDGGPWDNATINDTLHMIAPNSSDEILLMTGYFPYPTPSGILIVTRGVEGLKDIAALGNLSTESPTILTFNASGYTNCLRSDIGKPVKCNGNPLEYTVLIAYDNSVRKWWLSRPHEISVGDVLTLDGGQGAGTRDNQQMWNTGGGAIMIGKAYQRYDDPPRICLTNGDTLYITAGSSLPNGADAITANLKVKDLTATGNIHSANSGSGGVFLDIWGNLCFSGGNTTNTWSVFDNSENPVFTIPNQTGAYAEAFIGCSLNPRPSGTNYGLGSGSNRWAGIVVHDIWYGNAYDGYDAIDDLAYVKQIKTMTITENGKTRQVIDPETLELFKAEVDPTHPIRKDSKIADCIDMSKIMGFILCCQKAVAVKLDEHDASFAEVANLKDEIADIRAQVQTLQGKTGA